MLEAVMEDPFESRKTLYVSQPPRSPGNEPHQHNYRLKIDRLTAAGKLSAEKGKLHDLGIAHDEWCASFKGGFCNCDPEIYLNGKLLT